MGVLEWKNFNLFKILSLTELPKLKQIKNEITSMCSNSHYKVFCDDNGWVHVYQKNWDCVSFQAFSYPIKLCALTGNTSSIFLALSQDDESNGIHLQVFNLQKMTKKNGAVCLGAARLNSVLSSAQVLQSCSIESQICIAIGFERGDLYFFKGAMSRDISSNFKCFPITTKALTGIGFKQKDASVHMFVSSNSGIFCFKINDYQSLSESKVVLDSSKEQTQHGTMGYNILGETYYTVAREKAVYCFTSDGLGPCYAIEGEKVCLGWLGNFLILAIKQQKSSYIQQQTILLIMVDVLNKMIVLNKEIDQIWNIIIQNNICFVITKNKEVFLLREKNSRSKINMLVKKNLYDIALSQLGEYETGSNLEAEVNLQYGDYLFQKGDLENSIQKYIKTIGYIEPYCIIKKLLDTRYTKNLIAYLEALLQTEYGTKEHYELLLNCKERIEMPTKVENQCYNGYAPLDVLHISSPKISIKDYKINSALIDKYSSFIEVIHDLNRIYKIFENSEEEEILAFLKEHQQSIDLHYPKKILNILKMLLKKDKIKAPENFLVLLLADSDNTNEFLDFIIQMKPDCSPKIFTYRFEYYLESWKQGDLSESELMEFLQKYDKNFQIDHLMILCRMFSFWKGCVYLLEKTNNNELSALYFLKTSEFQKNLDKSYSKYNSNFLMQILKDGNNRENENITNLVNVFLNATLKDKPNTMLKVIESIANNKNMCVAHVKEFFNQEFLRNLTGPGTPEQIVKSLEKELEANQNLYKSYLNNPIEFRNSLCDKCRQELTFPAVYFICQHAFHKDCLNYYSEENTCAICPSLKNIQSSMGENKINSSDCERNVFETLFPKDAVNEVAHLLSEGIFNEILEKKNLSAMSQVETLHSDKSLNPFDNEGNTFLGKLESERRAVMLAEQMAAKQKHSQINTNPFEDESTNPFEDDSTNPFANDD